MREEASKLAYGLVIGILLVAATYGLITVAKFIGYASFAGEAGEIHELEIEFTVDQPYYGAISGVAVRSPFNSTSPENLEGNEIVTGKNLIFNCLNPDGEAEVYASHIPQENLSLDSVQAATQGEIDDYIGINDTKTVSATNTYTDTFSITLGNQTISAPGTLTFTDKEQDSNFTTTLLKDADGNLFFGSILTEQIETCFDGQDACNYQLLLPVKNGTNQTYHFWRDPTDQCPAGVTGGASLGNIIGNVTDDNGNPLEDVIIDVAGRTNLTNAQGFYNLTTIEGDHRIFAIKDGFQTYVANVTIKAGNTTVHNIVMLEEVEPNPLTGIGPGQDAPGTETQAGTGVGPGQDVGPGQAPQRPVVEEPKKIEGKNYIISMQEIKRKLRKGSFLQEVIKFFSFQDSTAQVNIEANGSVTEIMQVDKKSLRIQPDGTEEVTVTFFGRGDVGTYNGTLEITGDMNGTIPIEIELLPKDKLPVEALTVNIETSEKTYNPSDMVKFKTDLRNMVTDQSYPVQLFFTAQSQDGNRTLWTGNTNVFLKTSFSVIKSFELPGDLDPEDYVLRVTARYLGLSSGTSTIFKVERAWYNAVIFGPVKVWWLIALLFLAGGGAGAYWYIRKRIEEKKRYHLKVDYDTLPKPGPRSVFVGKIAEKDHKCYFNMEKFKTHCIVAGSTGGGKSVTAQVIIEEMLKKDVGVMVFDPTAQWSGMLRKCKDESMLELYNYFGMNKKEAQAFDGNVREVTDAREIIDVWEYMNNPGEINVFACHKLEPKEFDIVVSNAIRQVFKANLDESKPLRAMLVFDEVHRLLPKFGGSGDGFLQVERACREFRKWGVGVMLISQVLSDFMGTIKANINTEIQMRTRDEGDLERIRQKYGESVLRSLTMATVGTGMVENPAYNNGKPFFVAFRPLLHSVERLSDEEIEQYTEFNEQIDQLEYSLEQLEEKDVDVFDLKLELKLARDKVKTGNFNVVEVYLDGLKPRIEKEWDKLGEEPEELEKERISKEELRRMTEEAKEEREGYEAPGAEEEEAPEEKGPLEWGEDVNPDQLLNLENGMLVNSQQSLYDEIAAMDDETFEKHVNEDKHDFAEWIEEAANDQELAQRLYGTTDKEEILELLEMKKEGEDYPDLTDEDREMIKKYKGGQSEEREEEAAEEEGKEEAPETGEGGEEQPRPDQGKTPAKAADEGEQEEAPQPSEQVEEQPEEAKAAEEQPAEEGEAGEEETGGKDESLEELVAREPDQYFHLENGRDLKSVGELKDYLREMPDDIFTKHVGDDYNHFADWIEGVFQADDVANKIRGIKDKDHMAEVL